MKPGLALLVAALASTFATTALTKSEKVLYSFPYGVGVYNSEIARDENGVIVGPVFGPLEGQGDRGSIFQLIGKNGAWHEQTLYTFQGGNDGANPSSNVIKGPGGAYYGTTEYGGSGCGTAYSLARVGGKWTETQIHVFQQDTDGCQPMGQLLLDKTTGTIYGTAYTGGLGAGTVFALSRSGGTWTLATLYSFGQNGNDLDALEPQDGVRFGTNHRTLFGVTQGGGSIELGAIFMLTKTGSSWNETVLHSCTGYNDCSEPQDIDVDANGNIFGVDEEGGHYQKGTVFEFSNGTFSVLHSFGEGTDGTYPSGLSLESSTGNLFGTAMTGGTNDDGIVFELSQDNAVWTESILHNFGAGKDGSWPFSRPIEDPDTGNLYGTTWVGGRHGGGTVWMIAR
jgi:hypothetical protein